MGTRLSTDLGDWRLMRLLKAEAQERDTRVKEVLVTALEAYFADRLETKALAQLAGTLQQCVACHATYQFTTPKGV